MHESPPPRSLDPEAPLPGAPDPWAPSGMPAERPGPPYAMTEMIAAEPAFAERLLARLAKPGTGASSLAQAIQVCVAAGRAIHLVDCGTSEHGAIAAALILAEALEAAGLAADVRAVQAFEASLGPVEAGLLIGISHEGGTWATNLALERARAGGVTTALITVSDRSPGAALADVLVTTEEQDQSWCHTIGYLSPLLAATAIAAELSGRPVVPAAVRALLAEGAAQAAAAERIAAELADARHLLVVASGADRPAARELALKVEEASYLPTTMRDLETMLHGHLPATDDTTGLVLILTGRDGRPERLARAQGVLDAARAIGLRSAAIVAPAVGEGLPDDLTSVGRLVAPERLELPGATAALLGSAVPLQLLTERLARARGTDPDVLRRTDARYRAAAAAVE
ncbi:MAG: SIS domain-containing protein [Candidatus Limnocylindrales bacterium]